ncbi:MAG: HAD hydrolase family protein [Bacteroidales bacterium]
MSAIDYDLKRIKGIAFDVDGVLSASVVPIDISGEPLRMMNIKDGYAIQFAVKQGLNIAIITGSNSKGVYTRFKELGVEDIYMSSAIKMPDLNNWMQKRNLEPENVAYVGDDIPDIQVMNSVGLPVAPIDAAIDVKQIAKYISPVKGGEGCGRDLIEQVLRAQGKWLNGEEAYRW